MALMDTLVVQIKTVYGEDKIYPLSHEADLFCQMLNQKTLTKQNIEYLKLIGFTVMVEPNYPQKL